MILSLGFRFSLARPRSLGVALEVCHLVFLYPVVIFLSVVGGFLLWFLPLLSVTNLDEPYWSAVSICCWLACVGPRALQSLGVAFRLGSCGVYFILQFGSVSLRSDLGFEFRPLLSWLSIFWFGVPVSLGELLVRPVHFPESLSL